MTVEIAEERRNISHRRRPVASPRMQVAFAPIAISTTAHFADVEADWRQLERQGIDSPGQSFDFLKHWISGFDIPRDDQFFLVARAGKRPVLALALHRTRKWGMDVLTSFPGAHVGANSPLIDAGYMERLSVDECEALWRSVTQALEGADLAYIRNIPERCGTCCTQFEHFGLSVPGNHLHRAVFPDWETCDAAQRSRSRRKHDKQQGTRLTALGEVTFEVFESGDDVSGVLDVMFRQRNERFAAQGIADPFDDEKVRAFYARAFEGGKTLKGRLHVLRLNGEIVAVRYNLVHGDRMYCLISSMSTAPEVQPGSPGKQCLLRVMQSEFDNGFSMFDMGAGMTDEKRHWCNEHIPLRHHYVPLTVQGQVFTQIHRAGQGLKTYMKSQDSLFSTLKHVRSRVRGRSAGG